VAEFTELNKSYRSKLKIIRFVNLLFSKISKRIELGGDGKIAYDRFNMVSNSLKDEGEVEVKIEESKISGEASSSFVIKTLEKCLDSGGKPDDIFILSRTNKDLANWSESINSHKFIINNAEIFVNSYVLKDIHFEESKSILLFIDCLKYLQSVASEFLIVEIHSLISQITSKSEGSTQLKNQSSQGIFSFLNENCQIPTDRDNTIIPKLFELISKFEGLIEEESHFFKQFENYIFEKSFNECTIDDLLQRWSEGIKDQTLSPFPQPNSIVLCTIFKAKGLERDIVILPNLKIELSKKHSFWVGPDHPIQPIENIRYLSLNLYNLSDSSIFTKFYSEELHKVNFDNLNILYVGLTRAKSKLYVQVESMEDIYLSSSESEEYLVH